MTYTVRIHRPEDCAGPNCPFHNPSNHHMKNWPLILRETGLVERRCTCGVGHPDPDSIVYMNSISSEGNKGSWGVHGCCGCCQRENP